jgi:hypothetical protein
MCHAHVCSNFEVSMSAALLTQVRSLGVTITAQGENLLIRPASRLSPELLAQLRIAKPEILAHLRAETATQPAADQPPIPAAAAPQPHYRAPVSPAEPPAPVMDGDEPRTALIAHLLRWAAAYYPTRAEPPPDIRALRLTDAEIRELFTKAPSRQAHLALVDQPAIRNRLGDPALAASVIAAWAQKPVS